MMTVEIIGLCLAFLFVGLGLLGRSSLMSVNPCQMTYTTMQKAEINVSSSLGDVGTLYRHPMGTKLNKNPVLFIPGNMGSADQVRSLSSPMHNKDEVFQYFAVHFHKPLSAIHGSILLSQAAFVNDALEEIRALYKKPVQIMVVGHSLGGMVARTALTMSNHPKPCVVSDIVMLNTPNRGPAYSPDGSMEAVYNAVNKVWRESYYTDSAACKRSRLGESDAVLSRKRANPTINMNQKCALCAAEVRLLSVSGGDLDILVPAHLTPIDVVAPLARNQTHIESKKGNNAGGTLFGGNSIFLSAMGWLSPATWVRGAMSLFGWGPAPLANKATQAAAGTNATSAGDSASSDASDATADASSPTDTASSANASEKPAEPAPDSSTERNETESGPTGDPVYRLSLDEWNAHIAPYEESVQYSVRSVQIKEVGFPIDHNALLWCRQLMGQVSQTMTKLVERDEKARKSGKLGGATLTGAGLAKLIPSGQDTEGKAIMAKAYSEAKKMIAPVAAFHMRNATNHAFSVASEEEDRRYMAQALPLGYAQALAVSYVSNVWVADTLKWYMLLAIMALVVPLRRRLLSMHTEQPTDDWSVLSLHALLHLEDVAPAVGTLAQAVLSVLLPPAALQSPTYLQWFPSGPRADKGNGALAVLVTVAAAVVVRFLLDVWWVDSGALHSTLVRYNYRQWLHTAVSLFAALLVRMLLLVLAYGCRGGIRLVLGLLRSVARATVYRKGVRKAVRKLRKSLLGSRDSLVPHGFYIPVLFLAAMTALVASSWFSDNTARKELGFGYWVLLSVTLCAGGTAAVAVLRALFYPPHDESAEAYHLHTSLGLLYLPLVLLSGPTLGFAAFSLLGGGSATFKPLLPTFYVFSSAEMNTLLSLVCVALHLWTAAAYGPAYASLQESQPLVWASSLLGRSPDTTTGSSSGSSSSSRAKKSSGGGVKLWADGSRSDSEDEDEAEEQGFGGTLRIDGQCYHEDGGRAAIFEEVTLPSVQPASAENGAVDTGNGSGSGSGTSGKNADGNGAASPKASRRKRSRAPTQESPSPGVILGTTYRVVSCACAKDYRLKEQSEWCSFCQCKFCGGKDLHRAAASGGGWHPDYGYTDGRGGGKHLLDDISANVYLAVSLFTLGLLALMYAGDRPHRHLYMAGAVAAVYLLRDIACTLGMLKP